MRRGNGLDAPPRPDGLHPLLPTPLRGPNVQGKGVPSISPLPLDFRSTAKLSMAIIVASPILPYQAVSVESRTQTYLVIDPTITNLRSSYLTIHLSGCFQYIPYLFRRRTRPVSLFIDPFLHFVSHENRSTLRAKAELPIGIGYGLYTPLSLLKEDRAWCGQQIQVTTSQPV